MTSNDSRAFSAITEIASNMPDMASAVWPACASAGACACVVLVLVLVLVLVILKSPFSSPTSDSMAGYG